MSIFSNLGHKLFSRSHLPLLLPAGFFIGIGILIIMSSSSEFSMLHYGDPFHFAIKQGIWAVIGLATLLFAMVMPASFWQSKSLFFLGLNLLLLLVLFLPGLGKEVNSSTRWLSFGLFGFQPAEMLKFSVPLFLAAYLSYLNRNAKGGKCFELSIVQLGVPLAVLALISVLLLAQPDFASVFIFCFASVALLFFVGMRLRDMILLGFTAAGLAFMLIAFKAYRLNRFLCLDDANIWQNIYQECYQIANSLIAIERGGLWGSGFGSSIQKSFYLPEAYTDFVFAIMVEELGLVLSIVFIAVFVFWLLRILRFSQEALAEGYYFHSYFAMGVTMIWGLQFLCNVGVVLGYLPVTGLTLPFISYGGSSLVINMLLLGILARMISDVYDGLAAPVQPPLSNPAATQSEVLKI